jgi:hypothetical protein
MVDRHGSSGMSKRSNKTQASSAGEISAKPKGKDEQWDDRLRRVGNVNDVAVDWSAYDKPYWPLPVD